MAVDMALWRKIVVDEVESVSNEYQQRTNWFGVGDLIDSPGEQFCAFFDNASVPEFLARDDNGLNEQQKINLNYLSNMMRRLSDSLPTFIKPEDLIDDQRWVEIRKQAALTLRVLLET